MASELPSAMLTIVRVGGGQKTWRVQLTAQTPLESEALKAALVAKFIGESADVDSFDLRIEGTAGSPQFRLSETEQVFGAVEEV